MELQPNILKELGEETDVPVQPVSGTNFTADDDVLYLEDTLQRITLVGNINHEEYVTGMLFACIGLR